MYQDHAQLQLLQTSPNHICFKVTFSITIYAQPTFAAKQQAQQPQNITILPEGTTIPLSVSMSIPFQDF
ncbi:MAG: hypothetical protein AYK18_17730 [Theionarchaea archaeon DG-70]|nr:MAG: hypothetical protein AYK18_17730 [Theionarchaea archaeon DG-70]